VVRPAVADVIHVWVIRAGIGGLLINADTLRVCRVIVALVAINGQTRAHAAGEECTRLSAKRGQVIAVAPSA